MTISECIKSGSNVLQEVTENAFMEARELLVFVTGKTKEYFVTHGDEEISEKDLDKFSAFVKRRKEGEPLQYIIGETYFMGLPFKVNKNVLIPRADTEILVESVLKKLKKSDNCIILDMCTGSGCIAISLKKYLENSIIYGSDISEDALLVAKKNSDINQVDINWLLSDCFNNIHDIKFSAIVSNPPYITIQELSNLQKEVTYEPVLALSGGVDGLKFYKLIIEKARKYLADDGILAFEIGYRQAEEVSGILKDYGYSEIEVIRDYSENPRVVMSKWCVGGTYESD